MAVLRNREISSLIHHTYVGLLDRGERKPPIEVAERVALALGKKLSALIAESERARKD
jgi:hypothetical protein